jgi:TPR repeat protein
MNIRIHPLPAVAVLLLSLTACESASRPSGITREPAPAATTAPATRSLEDLRRAAERDNASTADQIALGERLLNGDGSGTGFDETGAAEWFSKAAERGDPLGKTRLADCLSTGRGIVIDRPRALALYREASESGLPEARYSLGICLAEGRGTPGGEKDLVAAAALWEDAAEAGSAPAQFRLALCRNNGEDGRAPDNDAAFKWFQRAANQGYAAAQANVGRAYLRGEGVAKDALRAYAWSTIAMDNEAALAKRTCDAAAKELTQTQIAEARRIAAEFRAKPETPGRAR